MTSEQSAVLTRPRQESRNGAAAKRMENFHFSEYDLRRLSRRNVRRGRCAAPDCEPLFRRMQTMTADDLARRQKAADRSMVQLGITFNVYGDTQGTRADLPVRHRAADHRQRANGSGSSAGSSSGSPRSTCSSTTSTTSSKIVRDGVVPEHVVATASRLPQAVHRAEAAARHLVPHHGHRPGARRRRPDLRAGRQPALPVGRVVRAGKPRSDEADVSAALRADCRSSRSTTIRSRLLDALQYLAPTTTCGSDRRWRC